MFNFTETQEKQFSSQYLKEAGLHTGAIFQGLTYEATPTYECFDLLFDVNGKIFKDRTFGTTLDRVLIKRVFDRATNSMVEETREEAYQRTYKEIYFKLLYLGVCFVDEATFRQATGTFSNLKDLVDKFNAVVPKENLPKVNILTGWKNSDSKQRSTLIIPERIQWVELTKYNEENVILPANIKLTDWQQQNMIIEKYPYNGTSNESTGSDNTILNDIGQNSSDLPF